MTNDTSAPAELLAEVPAPLHSLLENFWCDWRRSCESKEIDPEQSLPLAMLGKTWASSDFVARTCIRYPARFYQLLDEGFASGRKLDDYRDWSTMC